MTILKESDRPVPICPACSKPATESTTKYGIRAECCGMWSWGRKPLQNADTINARREANEIIKQLSPAMSKARVQVELVRRAGRKIGTVHIGDTSEYEALALKKAAEDIVMDLMSGKKFK